MRLRMTCAVLFSMLSAFLINTAVSASPSIAFQPSSKQVELGDEFTLNAVILDVEGLFGVSFEMQYDGNILDYVGTSAGDFMGDDVVFLDMKGDNNVSIAVSMKAGASPASGSGTIAIITFRAKAEGVSQISYRQETLSLQSSDGTPISATVVDGSVAVGSEPVFSIDPAESQLEPGDEVTLNAAISDVKELFGVSFEMQYDGNILDYVSASVGDFMGNDIVFLDMKGDNSVSIAVSMKAGASPASGSGIIAIITFRAKAEGTSQISYRQETLSLQRGDGTLIPAAVEDGKVTVSDTAASGLALFIDPSAKEVWVGEQFPMEVKIENATKLYAASFDLQFDKTMLKAVSAISGDFLGNDVINMEMPDDGSVSIGVSMKAGSVGVDGSGTIAIVTFEAIGDGDTDISFNSETITLKDTNDSAIDGFNSLNVNPGNISVRRPSLVPNGKLIRTWGHIRINREQKNGQEAAD